MEEHWKLSLSDLEVAEKSVELTIRFRTASRAEQVIELIRTFGEVKGPVFGTGSYPWYIIAIVARPRVPYVLGLAGVYGGIVPREQE